MPFDGLLRGTPQWRSPGYGFDLAIGQGYLTATVSSISVVPEPSTLALWLLALAGLAALHLRGRQQG